MATAVFNNPGVNQATGMQEQHHGLVLIYSAGKLIGIVFTKIPIPDIANMPTPGVPTNAAAAAAATAAAAGKPPNNPQAAVAAAAMLNANMQPNNPANNNLASNLMNNNMNNNNNANMQMLRNLTRHQQQMMTAAGGNPAAAAVQPGQNGKSGIGWHDQRCIKLKFDPCFVFHTFRLKCKQPSHVQHEPQ